MTRVVIPVPRHMTVEQAWLEIQTFGQLHGYSRLKPRFWHPRWAIIEVDDAEIEVGVFDDNDDDEWGPCD